LNCVG